MYIYLIILLVLIFLHLFFYKYKNIELEKIIWLFVILLLTFFIGFRNGIGGDWIHYETYYYTSQKHTFYEMLITNPVYNYINKIAYHLGIQLFGVNFICALIFMLSLSMFLNQSPNKWLALTISFPIIILILAMGFTRQGLAFSFLLFLIKSLEEKKLFQSFIFIILSILSHKSALFISTLLIFIFLWYHKKFFYIFISILIPIFFAFFFLGTYKHYIYYYVGSGQHMFSYGSVPRSILILFFGILFLIYKKKFNNNMTEYQIFVYTSFSWIVIFLFPFSIITSIVADRLLFYLYPLKLAFVSFANLKDKSLKFVIFLTISAYVFYLVLWLAFGINAKQWVPYKFIGF